MKLVVTSVAKQRSRDGTLIRMLKCAVLQEDGDSAAKPAATVAITDTGESRALADKDIDSIIEIT